MQLTALEFLQTEEMRKVFEYLSGVICSKADNSLKNSLFLSALDRQCSLETS
jgi:hypothetical protein